MWLKMIKNYTGKSGQLLLGDTRLDLQDEKLAEHLVKSGFAKKTPPPWDDNLDPNQKARSQATAKISAISGKLAATQAGLKNAVQMAAAIGAWKAKVNDLESQLKAAEGELAKLSGPPKKNEKSKSPQQKMQETPQDKQLRPGRPKSHYRTK